MVYLEKEIYTNLEEFLYNDEYLNNSTKLDLLLGVQRWRNGLLERIDSSFLNS